MLLDVTIERNGVDYRATKEPVALPPGIEEVRFDATDGRHAASIRGERTDIARELRQAGYVVVWSDPNPAVALGSRTSEHKSATARLNGARSKGRGPSVSLLCPEPVKSTLLELDKGTLVDLLYLQLKPKTGRLSTSAVLKALEAALQARQAKLTEGVAP